MKENIELIEKLAKLKQSSFREDQLEPLGIRYAEREDLVRKGLLKVDKSQPYPLWVFFLSDSAYSLIQNKQIGEKEIALTKENALWQKWGVIITLLSFGVAILALIVAIFALLKP